MSESRSRTPVFQDYYTDLDYDQVMVQLPDIIKDAERKAGEVMEPTIYEKREVMAAIKDFIRKKGRKVYGGTALNEVLIAANPADAIYDEVKFSDIEFYSPSPVPDLVELCDMLYKKGYKHIVGREAQHEETYSIFVNFQLYCDISYVPTRVYHGIKTIEIDGINYADPHFMFIDYLRVFNDPLNAAALKWEKYFPRVYKLLKNYPIEYYDKNLQIPKPSEEIQSYIYKIKNDFLNNKEVQQSCLIGGFDAYNFYIRHAAKDRNVEQMARTAYTSKRVDNMVVNVPYMELVSVNYMDMVERLYNFVKAMVPDTNEVSIEEYFPLFQFTNFSVSINYKGVPLAKIIEADGQCIPNIKTTAGRMYVSFQYLLMSMFINKFRAHLDKNREMYFNYGIAISNLVKARNIYLTENNLPVINKTVFGEFRVACVGTTVSYNRMARLRELEKQKKGKSFRFSYYPESFLAKSEEEQAKFDPSKHFFRNTSGNKITNPKNLLFKLDDKGNIRKDAEAEEAYSEDTETSEKSTDSVTD